VTGETEVTERRRRGRDTLAPRSARKPPTAPDSEGFVISSDRFWSAWRRNRGADASPGAGPRALNDLLKQVEKATQVRRSGLDQVLAELKLHRDATTDAELRSALAWLCNAVTRFGNNPTATHVREVMMAADAVRRAPAG
jgi:hypothetical protein